MWLQPTAHERFETGAGFAHAGLIGRDKANPNRVSDVRVKGEIIDFIDSEGRRQFTGSNSASYWTTRGTSGSPVFLEGGQQLAGIMSLSETGANEGETHRHEAFVIPATTIRKYLAGRLAADALAEKRGIDPAKLQPILAKLGVMDVPDEKVAERINASVDDILAQAAKPVPTSNDVADIDAAIKTSRAKLGALNTAGALDVLQAKIAGEEQERARRLVPLLKERAAVELLAFDYDAAKSTLIGVTRLAPDEVWAWIDLGDLYVTTGPLEEAAKAFRTAGEAARRSGGERDLSVALSRLGDVQRAQGDLADALKSFEGSLVIADRLANGDPGKILWQCDLSVAYEKIGDVQKVRGDFEGALKSYEDSLAIAERFAKSDPSNAQWQRDLSVAFNKVGDVQKVKSDFADALKSYKDSLTIRDTLAKSWPGNAEWQRDLSVSYNHVGDMQKKAQGDLEGALKSYRDGLMIIEPLAKSCPGNAQWQRDLSVSFTKIGDIQMAQGDLGEALKSYEAKRDIISCLAKSDPGNALWQRDLSVSFANLASVYLASGDNAKAHEALRQGQAIMASLTALSPENATWKLDLAWFDRQIKDLTP